MSRGFVICAFCGARIKADRGRCLRCGELLQAAVVKQPAPPSQLREWLQAAPSRYVAVIVVAAVALLAGGFVFTRSDSAPDAVARAKAAAAKNGAVTAPTVMTRSTASGEMLYPPTALDSVRLAGAEFTSGDFESAKIRYQQALQKKPDDPEALNGLGLVLERQGDIENAIAQFTRAAAAVPSSWAYRFNLAHALGERGRWEPAVEEYRAAAGLFPNDYATLYNLALAMHKKGDDDGAIPEFRKAIELAPREPSFHLSLGVSLEKTGKLSDAQREYQQYLDMAPWAPETEKLKDHLKALAAGHSTS